MPMIEFSFVGLLLGGGDAVLCPALYFLMEKDAEVLQ